MRIDRRLNLVIPLDDTSAGTVYVHATPISRAVFEKYYLVIAQTFTQIYRRGLELMSGPRVAYMMLRDTAREQGVWDGPDGVERGLVNEIRRLTNVCVCTADRGWHTVPLEHAVRTGVVDEDDEAEVMNALAFFTCAAAIHSRSQLPAILDGIGLLWGALTTSSDSTEYCRSLQTSTATDSSSETPPTLLVPS